MSFFTFTEIDRPGRDFHFMECGAWNITPIQNEVVYEKLCIHRQLMDGVDTGKAKSILFSSFQNFLSL